MNAAQYILIGGVRMYRWVLSPAKTALLGPAGLCRFEPSCSSYALEALKVHGAMKGTWLATKRLCRCHPWGKFGPDPVPKKCGMRNAECGIDDYAAGSTRLQGLRGAGECGVKAGVN